MFGEILGAIGGILGALGGSEDKEVTSHVDYKRMVREAEAAGFNPLTAIRNGGSAGFTTTSTPGLSAASAIGEAMGSVGNFMANYDPMADKKRELEYAIQQAQLEALQMDTSLKRKASIGGVPVRTAGTSGRTAGKGVPAGLGVLTPETQTPQRTNPFPSWLPAEVNPWSPDMQNWEDHFGDNEIMSMAGSALQIGSDLAWNAYRGARAFYNSAAWPRSAPLSRKAPKSSGRAKLPSNPLAWPSY